MEGVAGAAIATSPAMMAYVTTETGVATMIIMVLVAGYLLTRRAADFDKAEPRTPGQPPNRALLRDGHAETTPAKEKTVNEVIELIDKALDLAMRALELQQHGGRPSVGDQHVDPSSGDRGMNSCVLALAAGDADASWDLMEGIGIDADYTVIESAGHQLARGVEEP